MFLANKKKEDIPKQKKFDDRLNKESGDKLIRRQSKFFWLELLHRIECHSWLQCDFRTINLWIRYEDTLAAGGDGARQASWRVLKRQYILWPYGAIVETIHADPIGLWRGLVREHIWITAGNHRMMEIISDLEKIPKLTDLEKEGKL